MDYIHYIKNPESLNDDVVGQLKQIVERHPYFHSARLLYVRGLYQLQSDAFGPELRKAAVLLPDRTQLFELLEGYKYKVAPERRRSKVKTGTEPQLDRTISLIDSFLAQSPEQNHQDVSQSVDASVDYISYLMQMEDIDTEHTSAENVDDSRTTQIIDEFIEDGGGRIMLPSDTPDVEEAERVSADHSPLESESNKAEETEKYDYFTETLARIYIKQGKYSKAIEIIKRLNLMIPKKNAYFADQIRFLRKLELNSQHKI
ncbi:MAG: hypothetical protein K6F94_02290 [Bacteroidaceae bacterium]|nr:hypothetical protein [Bacteroidaceae bacterium]